MSRRLTLHREDLQRRWLGLRWDTAVAVASLLARHGHYRSARRVAVLGGPYPGE